MIDLPVRTEFLGNCYLNVLGTNVFFDGMIMLRICEEASKM